MRKSNVVILLVCLSAALPATALPTCDNGSSEIPYGTPPFLLDAFQWTWCESVPVGVTRTAATVTPDGNIHLVCGNTMLAETSYAYQQVYVPGADSWYVDSLAHPVGGNRGVHNHDAKCLGNKIWVGGGSWISGYYSNLTMIDLEAHTWTVIGPMPVTDMMYYEFCAGSDGKLYMFGDDAFSNAAYVFDTTARTWTTRATMPEGLANPAAACIGDTIYLFGGQTSTSVSAATRAYSITGNNWATRTSAPTARYWHTASVVNTDSGPMVYVCGGVDAGGSVLNTVERYNVLTNTWTTQSSLQQIRRSHGGVTLADSVFIISGFKGSRPFVRSTELGYDPDMHTSVAEPGSGVREQGLVIRLAPNPCAGQTEVLFTGNCGASTRLTLYNAAGRAVKNVRLGGSNGQVVLPVADLNPGVYWLSVSGVRCPVAGGRRLVVSR